MQKHTCAGDCLPTKRSCCSVRSTVVCFWKLWRAFDGPQRASAMSRRKRKGYQRMLKSKERSRKKCVTEVCRGTPSSCLYPNAEVHSRRPELALWGAIRCHTASFACRICEWRNKHVLHRFLNPTSPAAVVTKCRGIARWRP
jgi:hypothetical protein